MTKDAREIEAAFDLISTACWNIKENDQCDRCPLKHICLEETALIEVADLVSGLSWDDFLRFSDECLPSEELQNDMAMNQAYDEYRDKEDGL